MRTWKRSPIVALLLALAIGGIAGCSNDAPVYSPTTTPGVTWSEAAAPYQLVFISRDYDSENDETTYLYQLQNVPDLTAGESGAELPVIHVFTNVLVELPACAPAPASFAPADGATIYTNPSGLYGIEWGIGYDENPNFYYSVTFPGDVPQGVVRGMVTLLRDGELYVDAAEGFDDRARSVRGRCRSRASAARGWRHGAHAPALRSSRHGRVRDR